MGAMRISRFVAIAVAAGCVLASVQPAQAAASTAGVFQFVAGEVKLFLATGSERPARKGAPLSVGDTVATAKGGFAQIKMGDGAIVVVQPESRLKVAEFRYEGKEDGTEKVLYRLERGGFRAVTGVIGRTNKENYLIETPIAHMGVRGTDHESYYFPGPGPANGEPARPGVYNKVNVGLAYIRTQAGEVLVRPNEVGYAASAQAVPGLLPAVPGFFNRAVEPKSAQRAPEAGAVAQSGEDRAAPAVPQVARAVGLASAPGLTYPAAEIAAAPGAGSFVGYTVSNDARSGANLAISPNGATLANAGGDAAFGVNWGSWPGGLATVGGSPTTGSVHFIESNMLTTAAQLAALGPTLVSATYNYLGGPAPTNQAGIAGTINSLAVTANFSTQTITQYNLNASVAGKTWTTNSVLGPASFANFTGSSGIMVQGNCTGCAPGNPAASPAANGTAHGAFVGSAAQRMVTSFGLQSAAGQKVSGAAYLGR